MTETLDYSKLSYEATKSIDKKIKKEYGIYFTHPLTIQKNLKILDKYMKNVKSVLEPSFGTGEYINAIINGNSNHDNLTITGIELNKTIYDSVMSNNTFDRDQIHLLNEDFIQYDFKDRKYDLIIGNPPYFVIKKSDVSQDYLQYFEGRPNLFVLFILKSLDMLADDGILSFVLPRNFQNSLYFNKVRERIYNNFEILNLFECDDNYIETKQKTIILIVMKKEKITKSIVNKNRLFVVEPVIKAFGTRENIKTIKNLMKGSKTLEQMGFKVSVGKVVWNQNKQILTSDKNKTRLIYSSDISDKTLVFKKYSNEAKKNFIDKKGLTGPILVLNRGYGVGDYKFEYCLINKNFEYLIENHLICIEHIAQINDEELIEKYEKIIESFENDKTLEFIKTYFGNNAINTTELCKILPIYI
tara:strand:+ start:1431 stop:2675 length:1245 start_codon:yes stop_codon:yes gene_type:complete